MKKIKSLTTFFISSLLFITCTSQKEAPSSVPNILGSWELVRFENIDSGEIIDPPDTDTQITITFSASEYSGFTERNSFFGSYEIDVKELKLFELNTTEVGETEWGELFYSAINEVNQNNIYLMNYSFIENSKIRIEYDQNKFMHFVKL